MISCSEDDVQPDSSNNSQVTTDKIEIDETVNYTSSDFDFSTVEENDTLNIAYIHDLEGKNIILPPHVVIKYYGGSIINGTLTFDNGIIDGELLNYQLEITGSATLSSTTFDFVKSKWNITEGEVSDEVAIVNKKSIQKAIDDSKRLGATTFYIGALDAYFNVTFDTDKWNYYRYACINIPSNFVLQMTDNTYIRVQPNKMPKYTLFQIYQVSNVKISGGNLLGDRDEHDYTTISDTHESGYLMDITAGENILVDGVVMKNSTGDGMGIGCIGTYTDRGLGLIYQQSSDVTVKNCTFDSNRRNGISPGDGLRITIDNNEFLNSGIDTEKSEGTAPRCAIDVESWWDLDENGDPIKYHTTTDFVISNNIERGGANISFIVAVGENVTMENNDVQQRMGFNTGRNITIRNNNVATRIFVGDGKDRTYPENLMVYNNTILSDTTLSPGKYSDNDGTGIYVSIPGKSTKIYNNKIYNKTTGIAIRNSNNCEIYDNYIEPRQDISVTYGIYAYAAVIDNMQIYNNSIVNCSYMPILFSAINNIDGGENNIVTIFNNYSNENKMLPEEVIINNSKGVTAQ